MKRCVLIILVLVTAAGFAGAGTLLSVQLRTAPVKKSPSAWGPLAGSLSYGDRVEVLERSSGWMRVRSEAGLEGWVSSAALTTKKVEMKSSGQVAGGASTEEVALAGKGFNADVEREYKEETALDFSWVDKMESWGVESEELADFLFSGGLGRNL